MPVYPGALRVADHSEVGQTNQYKRVYQELSLELEGF